MSSAPAIFGLGAAISTMLALWPASAASDPRPMPPPAPRGQEALRAAEPARPDIGPIKDAVIAYRKGDLGAGDAIRARVESPGAGHFLDWAAIRLGGVTVPFERVVAFGLAYPDFPGQAWVRRRAEETLLAERKPAATVRAFFARERPQTPAGKLALALAFRAEGLGEDADALVRDAWRNDTFGRDLELRIIDAFKDTLTLADHRVRMERFLLRENFDAGRRGASYAGPSYDALVKARVAVDGRAANAPKLVDAVPAELKRDLSWLFSRVQNLRRTEKAAEAAGIMAGLTRDPALLADGDAWWVERRLVARKLLDDGDPKTAYQVAAGHAAATAERRVEGEFMAGWIALRYTGDLPAARRHFDRAAAIAGTPTSRSRAAYWQGRAADASGAAEEARGLFAEAARYGATYYGQIAAARIGAAEVSVRRASDPDSPDRRAASRLAVVEAVGYGYAAGLRELAGPLAVEFGRGGTNVAAIESVADIVAQNADVRTLLTLGKLAHGRGLPIDEAAFPTSGIPAFDPLGTPVEPALVHAIARQESAFDPAAGSSAGARGLMQMMPGTAQATAKKAGIAYEASRLLEGVYNARLGAAHLGDLMEDWKGSLILTFASYNAGPGNARKWIQAYGDPRIPGVDPIDWVERIPFGETRNYVQRVMENLQVYRRRLDLGSALLIDRDMRGGAAISPGSRADAGGKAVPAGMLSSSGAP